MPEDIKYPERKPKQKTPEQALAALMRYCSRAERSSGDAMRLMRGWSIAETDAAAILTRLQKERFIDDARFAGAYVRDKSRFSGWGPHKIAAGLRGKGISPETIKAAMEDVAPEQSSEKLEALLDRKFAGLKGTVYEKKGKLVRFGLSRGFGYEEVMKVCDRLLKDDE